MFELLKNRLKGNSSRSWPVGIPTLDYAGLPLVSDHQFRVGIYDEKGLYKMLCEADRQGKDLQLGYLQPDDAPPIASIRATYNHTAGDFEINVRPCTRYSTSTDPILLVSELAVDKDLLSKELGTDLEIDASWNAGRIFPRERIVVLDNGVPEYQIYQRYDKDLLVNRYKPVTPSKKSFMDPTAYTRSWHA